MWSPAAGTACVQIRRIGHRIGLALAFADTPASSVPHAHFRAAAVMGTLVFGTERQAVSFGSPGYGNGNGRGPRHTGDGDQTSPGPGPRGGGGWLSLRAASLIGCPELTGACPPPGPSRRASKSPPGIHSKPEASRRSRMSRIMVTDAHASCDKGAPDQPRGEQLCAVPVSAHSSLGRRCVDYRQAVVGPRGGASLENCDRPPVRAKVVSWRRARKMVLISIDFYAEGPQACPGPWMERKEKKTHMLTTVFTASVIVVRAEYHQLISGISTFPESRYGNQGASLHGLPTRPRCVVSSRGTGDFCMYKYVCTCR